MLDHLTNGRFEFGTGRGSSTTEQQGFGIPEPDLTKAMFDEVIVEFRKMWSETRVQPRRRVLLDADAEHPAEALRQTASADVGGGRQSGHVREGRRDGTRRVVLHRRQPDAAGAARRDLQEHHRRRRARRRVRQRQRRRREPVPVPRGPRRGARLADEVRGELPQQLVVPVPRHVPATRSTSRRGPRCSRRSTATRSIT